MGQGGIKRLFLGGGETSHGLCLPDRVISGALTLKSAVFTLAQHSILHRLMVDRPYEGGPGRKKKKILCKVFLHYSNYTLKKAVVANDLSSLVWKG